MVRTAVSVLLVAVLSSSLFLTPLLSCTMLLACCNELGGVSCCHLMSEGIVEGLLGGRGRQNLQYFTHGVVVTGRLRDRQVSMITCVSV